MPAWQGSMPCHSHRHKNKMCVAKECSNSIMAAAKDDDNQETTDQDEPGSTCTEYAFCILGVIAILSGISLMTLFVGVLCQIFVIFPAESLKLC